MEVEVHWGGEEEWRNAYDLDWPTKCPEYDQRPWSPSELDPIGQWEAEDTGYGKNAVAVEVPEPNEGCWGDGVGIGVM